MHGHKLIQGSKHKVFFLHVESPSPNCDYPIWPPKNDSCFNLSHHHSFFSIAGSQWKVYLRTSIIDRKINIFKGSGWHCVMRCLLFNYFVWNTQFMSHWIPNSYPVEWCRCENNKKPSGVDNPWQSYDLPSAGRHWLQSSNCIVVGFLQP